MLKYNYIFSFLGKSSLIRRICRKVIASPHEERNRSTAWSPSDIASLPHMEPEGARHFEDKLQTASTFLEYGAGGSTILAARTGLKKIYSVESDRSFLDAVRQRLSECAPDLEYSPLLADIGPTKEWGFPLNDRSIQLWPLYCATPWQKIIEDQSYPDLVLIDGRFRISCLLITAVLAKNGTTILFDDYFNRPQYASVEKILSPVNRAGRMAEFKVTDDLRRDLALFELFSCCTDPS